MKSRSTQAGEINVLLIPLILMVVFLIGTAVFAVWAFNNYQDYKNHSDQKAAAASAEAVKQEDIKKDQQFAEAEKQPLTPYDGPSAYGSIHVEYPKTWSVYVDSSSSQSQPLDSYFNPKYVPSIHDQASVFALRVKVTQETYASILKSFDGSVKTAKVTIKPYSLPKVSNVVGVRVDGLIQPGKKTSGSMIIMPLRDKSIEVWTENQQEMNDFNNFILPNLTFAP